MACQIPIRVFRQTGPMNCWFYAAKAVIFNRTRRLLLEADYMGAGAGARATIGEVPDIAGRTSPAEVWLQRGLPRGHVGVFANVFHFRQPGDLPAVWTAPDIEAILRRRGPLWFAGHSGQFGHIVVLCGVSDDNVVSYGDPATGRVARTSLDDFNTWKEQFPGLRNPLYYG